MIRVIQIKKITFKNFIPYYDIKVFDFGEKKGTTIIFGNNNTGKSSFISGIRFLLFNHLRNNPDNRHYKIKPIINQIAFRNEAYDFYVYMEFVYNDKNYKLKRECRLSPDIIGEPKSDNDFECHLSLYEDGKNLSKTRIDDIIKSIMPENISEFMLFDGENIEKYVEILNNDSSSGVENKKVKEAINNIIGTPYIDSTIARLDTIKDVLKNDHDAKIMKINKNQKLNKDIKDYENKIKSKRDERIHVVEKRDAANKELTDINQELNEQGRLITTYNELKEKEKERAELNSAVNLRKEDLKQELLSHIKGMQYQRIASMIDDLRIQYQDLEQKENQIIELRKSKKQYEELLERKECPYCGSHIDREKFEKYRDNILRIERRIESNSFTSEEKDALKSYREKTKHLGEILDQITRVDIVKIKGLLEEIYTKQNAMSSIKNEISSLTNNLGADGADQARFFKEKFAEKSKLEKIVEEADRTIEIMDKDINDYQKKLNSLRKKIEPNQDIRLLENEINLITSIRERFVNLKERFIDQMRRDVQCHASDIFLRFIEGQNSDIRGLEINSNYRMKIAMKDDTIMPIPGKGYSTLLALSLIYGLNANSNLFGTIFFDAAFSVLQKKYTDNIIKTFSEIAPQLILLVHDDKIDMQLARNMLGNKLVRELEIYQEGNSYHTKVREAR
jgi:DNA sulfur modification protein DndD